MAFLGIRFEFSVDKKKKKIWQITREKEIH